MMMDVPVGTAHVVHIYPHDRQAFTEGLYYEDGFLFESTGGYAQAGVRKVRLGTGEVLQRRDTPRQLFGEVPRLFIRRARRQRRRDENQRKPPGAASGGFEPKRY